MIHYVDLWINIIKLKCNTFFLAFHFQCFQVFLIKVWKSEEENRETKGNYSSGCFPLSRIKRSTQYFNGPVTEYSSFSRIRVSRCFPTVPLEDGFRFTSRNLVLLSWIPGHGKMRILSNSKCDIPSPESLRTEKHEPYPFNRLLSFSTIH
jgi:hypothetical protein